MFWISLHQVLPLHQHRASDRNRPPVIPMRGVWTDPHIRENFSLFVLLESTPRTFSLTSQLISMNCLLFELLCRQRERPSRLIDDDPLRLPPRRPPDVRNEWYMYFQGNIEQYRKQSFTPPSPPYLKINLVYNRFLHGYGPLKAKVILIKNRIDAFEMITSLKCSFSSCV